MIKAYNLDKKAINTMLDDGVELEGFIGGFKVTDLTAEVVGLPNCEDITYTQNDDEVETIARRNLTVDEYFGTKREVDGVTYVYAQIKRGKNYNYTTGAELIILRDLFGKENLLTKSEWNDLIVEIPTETMI